jgi:hypothetical protein
MVYGLAFILALAIVVPWVGIPLFVLALVIQLRRAYRLYGDRLPNRHVENEGFDAYFAKWQAAHPEHGQPKPAAPPEAAAIQPEPPQPQEPRAHDAESVVWSPQAIKLAVDHLAKERSGRGSTAQDSG